MPYEYILLSIALRKLSAISVMLVPLNAPVGSRIGTRIGSCVFPRSLQAVYKLNFKKIELALKV